MSQILVRLDGADAHQTRRIQRILEILFDQNFFGYSNGKIICHFDEQGVMRQMEWGKVKWRKEKMTTPLVIEAFKSFHVHVQ